MGIKVTYTLKLDELILIAHDLMETTIFSNLEDRMHFHDIDRFAWGENSKVNEVVTKYQLKILDKEEGQAYLNLEVLITYVNQDPHNLEWLPIA